MYSVFRRQCTLVNAAIRRAHKGWPVTSNSRHEWRTCKMQHRMMGLAHGTGFQGENIIKGVLYYEHLATRCSMSSWAKSCCDTHTSLLTQAKHTKQPASHYQGLIASGRLRSRSRGVPATVNVAQESLRQGIANGGSPRPQMLTRILAACQKWSVQTPSASACKRRKITAAAGSVSSVTCVATYGLAGAAAPCISATPHAISACSLTATKACAASANAASQLSSTAMHSGEAA